MISRLLRLAFRLAAALGAFGGAGHGFASELKLPPIVGELTGDYTPPKPAGAPTLRWQLTLSNPVPSERVARVIVDGLETHAIVELRLDATGDGTWKLAEGRAGLKPWLAGQLVTGEVAVTGEGTLKDGAIAGGLKLTATGLDLGELLRFSDADKKYFRAAEGRVGGTIGVGFKAGSLTVDECLLEIPAGTIGLITFYPNPGLLTSYVPALVRRLAPGLDAIELGRTPLEARVLRLTVLAVPDEAGRRAFIHIEGRPHDPKLIAPLILDINLPAELERVIRGFLALRLSVAGP